VRLGYPGVPRDVAGLAPPGGALFSGYHPVRVCYRRLEVLRPNLNSIAVMLRQHF
jgi:hypothetical protein